jgi:hypothetical protein
MRLLLVVTAMFVGWVGSASAQGRWRLVGISEQGRRTLDTQTFDQVGDGIYRVWCERDSTDSAAEMMAKPIV